MHSHVLTWVVLLALHAAFLMQSSFTLHMWWRPCLEWWQAPFCGDFFSPQRQRILVSSGCLMHVVFLIPAQSVSLLHSFPEIVLSGVVELGLDAVFWFPNVVKRAVFWWRDNPTHSACWYTRSRIRIAEVIACTRPTAFALFMARTHYRSSLKHQLRGLETSEISVWSSSTIYLEVSRSRIRV